MKKFSREEINLIHATLFATRPKDACQGKQKPVLFADIVGGKSKTALKFKLVEETLPTGKKGQHPHLEHTLGVATSGHVYALTQVLVAHPKVGMAGIEKIGKGEARLVLA